MAPPTAVVMQGPGAGVEPASSRRDPGALPLRHPDKAYPLNSTIHESGNVGSPTRITRCRPTGKWPGFECYFVAIPCTLRVVLHNRAQPCTNIFTFFRETTLS